MDRKKWSREEILEMWPQAVGELRGFQAHLESRSGITAAQLGMALQLAEEEFKRLKDKQVIEGDVLRAQSGDKVIFKYPEACELWNRKNAKEHLKMGETYTVDRVSIHREHTNVYLREFPGVRFNSAHFVLIVGGG